MYVLLITADLLLVNFHYHDDKPRLDRLLLSFDTFPKNVVLSTTERV